MLPYIDVIIFFSSISFFLLLTILAGRYTRPQEVRRHLNFTRLPSKNRRQAPPR